MSKKIVLIGLIIFLVLAQFTPAYCDDPVKKLGRGIANVISCPLELFYQPSKINEVEGPTAAMTWGVLKGIGMVGIRAAVGIYEIVTFPIPAPKNYAPILTEPEFFFEEQNW